MKNDNKYLSQIKLREIERQLIMSCSLDIFSTQKWKQTDRAILSNVQSLEISNYHPSQKSSRFSASLVI